MSKLVSLNNTYFDKQIFLTHRKYSESGYERDNANTQKLWWEPGQWYQVGDVQAILTQW